MKYSIIAVLALFMSACSAVPEELVVPENTTLASFETALENPEQAVGQMARWGGTIAEVRNTESGTIIEVVNFPLQSWARPLVSDESNGRFRAKVAGFVDPMVYKKGRIISFVGTVGEPEQGTIDEFRYLFPILNVDNKHLWKELKETKIEVDYSSLWYRHHYYSRPYPYIVPVRSVPTTGDSGGSSDGNN